MRLAVWTPGRDEWTREVAGLLARESGAVIVGADQAPPSADLHLYDVADHGENGYVYRALLREPGLVLLHDWGLHTLVHAETAGRGDCDGYRREARRAHGPTGAFVAAQVLAGFGGLLPSLLPFNQRLLDASAAVVATSPAVYALARGRLQGRPVVQLDRASCAPALAAAALRELAQQVLPALNRLRRALAARRAEAARPLGRALLELRPFAQELGLAELPSDAAPLLAPLFPQPSGVAEGSSGGSTRGSGSPT